MRNGCKLIEAASGLNKQKKKDAYIANWTGRAMIDEKFETGWCSQRGFEGEKSFIFELSEDYHIDELKFYNSKDPTYFGLNSKKITIEYSKKGPYSGYKKVGSFILQQHKSTTFEIPSFSARWIKLTIHSNYGNSEYTELMEFEALGYFDRMRTKAIDLKGSWETNFGTVSLNENEHGLLYGCFKHSHGEIVTEGVYRRKLNIKWAEPSVEVYGWAVLVLNKEGEAISGIWGYEDDSDDFGFWEFGRKNKKVKHCENDKLLSEVYPELHNNEVRFKLKLLDNHTKKAVTGLIELEGEDGSSYVASSNNEGIVELTIDKNTDYFIKIQSRAYYTVSEQFKLTKFEMKYRAEVEKSYGLKKLEVGHTFNLSNIMFHQGTSKLISSSFTELNKLLELMIEHPLMKIELCGHTENTGSAKANLILSQERVQVVMDYLIDNGVNPNRMRGVGYGGSRPIASNANEETRKLNRRVELVIIKL